ncbi:MAG TPA: VOC family protein [bacterium]|jgi:methylmalonyl-CoA/ethylmalonyl-CoA epimerase
MPRLNHIAVLVENLDSAVSTFTEVWGLAPSEIVTLEKHGIRTAVFNFDNIKVELMEPSGPDTGTAKQLEKRGPGIAHMAIESENVLGKMGELKSKGLRFTTEEPSLGLHDSLIAFLHPKDTHGILTEIVQPSEEMK